MQTGRFGPIAFGMTHEELQTTLGEPDAVSVPRRRRHKPDILKYGDFEFHFTEGHLELIFVDTFTGSSAAPQGGSRLLLDPWIIRGGLPRSAFEKAIIDIGLSYRQVLAPVSYYVWLCLQSGVVVGFSEGEANANEVVGLCFLSHKHTH